MDQDEHRLSTRVDVTDFLESPEDIAYFLDAALAEGDQPLLVAALDSVARSRGLAKVAARAGVNRESLYRTLREGRDARLSTISRVLRACGLRLAVVPLEPDDAA